MHGAIAAVQFVPLLTRSAAAAARCSHCMTHGNGPVLPSSHGPPGSTTALIWERESVPLSRQSARSARLSAVYPPRSPVCGRIRRPPQPTGSS